MSRAALAASLAIALSFPAWAANLVEGLVVSVHDGDSLTVVVGKQLFKVRLAEIDAPELRQPYGKRSRQSLADLCFDEPASLEVITVDRYGRSVGKVDCAGTDASAHQVTTGMAWVYDRYSTKSSPLYVLQMEAKGAKRGLWTDDHPIAPWAWRRVKSIELAPHP